MGDRAPDEGRMQQTRNLEVVDELPLSLEETVVSLRGERRPIASLDGRHRNRLYVGVLIAGPPSAAMRLRSASTMEV